MNFYWVLLQVIWIKDVDRFVFPVIGILAHGSCQLSCSAGHSFYRSFAVYLLPCFYADQFTAGTTFAIGSDECHVEAIGFIHLLHYL